MTHFIYSPDSTDVKQEANHSALVLDSVVRLFPFSCAASGAPGRLPGSASLKVIDEGVIRYLSVSLLWCQRDEGEIKRG